MSPALFGGEALAPFAANIDFMLRTIKQTNIYTIRSIDIPLISKTHLVCLISNHPDTDMTNSHDAGVNTVFICLCFSSIMKASGPHCLCQRL